MGGRRAVLMSEMKNNVSLGRRGVELLNNAQLNACFANQLQERKIHVRTTHPGDLGIPCCFSGGTAIIGVITLVNSDFVKKFELFFKLIFNTYPHINLLFNFVHTCSLSVKHRLN